MQTPEEDDFEELESVDDTFDDLISQVTANNPDHRLDPNVAVLYGLQAVARQVERLYETWKKAAE